MYELPRFGCWLLHERCIVELIDIRGNMCGLPGTPTEGTLSGSALYFGEFSIMNFPNDIIIILTPIIVANPCKSSSELFDLLNICVILAARCNCMPYICDYHLIIVAFDESLLARIIGQRKSPLNYVTIDSAKDLSVETK